MHYRTVIQHYHAGDIKGFSNSKGTIFLKNPFYHNQEQQHGHRVILYARVSSSINKASMDGQLSRMREYAAAKGYQVVGEVREISSGLNDKRRKLSSILKRDDWDILLVEHRDRLTRFGWNYFSILERLGQHVESINISDDKNTEIVDDLISIITSFCGRIYGSQRKKKTEQIIKDVKSL
jgi:predicted site-specific integrase-resolvase